MMRVVTTLILAAAVLAGIWYLPLPGYQLFILLAVGLGLGEYGRLMFSGSSDRFFVLALGLLAAAFLIWRPVGSLRDALLLPAVFSLFAAFLWGMKFRELPERSVSRVGLIFLGVCYLGLTLPFWSAVREMGREWVMLLLFPACLTDTFSFLAGKTLGRHKLAAVISPNKTWEGFFGGLFGGVFGLWLAGRLFFDGWEMAWLPLIGTGVGISLLAILGDLIESLIKRSAGAKDSSHLIPGHGGALDRLDALIFVAPFFYWVVQW